jgi:nondiscriminating glutamyl-tRNA synthetase
MSTPIRTRFAPSPTGYLHIGGVRTALFNWLLTRRLGGQFILRIDDTDAERNKAEALQPILDGFRWLGINWDEGPEVGGPYGPYFQSQRNHLYLEAALKLLETGRAYPDYVAKEQLDAERKAAEKAKKPYVHRGPHRETPAAECVRLYRAQPTTLRLKVPPGQTVAIEDLIRGPVQWDSNLIGDPVILRADGSALYNFATVVDDVGMKITHVIRAAEHLANTTTQVMIYEALGAAKPHFAHIPVVNEPAPKPGIAYAPGVKPPNPNKKLSKREMAKFLTPDVRAKLHAVGWTDEQINSRDDLNPATVAFYRELGYLPAGLVNYLGRLGWSLDDKTEIIPIQEMIAHFSLERVNQSPASFDPEKLLWVAGETMRLLPLEQKIVGVIPFLRKMGCLSDTVDDAMRARIGKVVEVCGDRLKVFSDILMYGSFFFKPPVYDPAALAKRLHKDGIPALVGDFAAQLPAIDPFDAPTLEAKARAFCDARGAKIGDLNHGLRVATTGVMVGPGMFDILSILGPAESLRRIETALKL